MEDSEDEEDIAEKEGEDGDWDPDDDDSDGDDVGNELCSLLICATNSRSRC